MQVRAIVAGGDRESLLELLEDARARAPQPPDRASPSTSRWSSCASRCPTAPGVIAEVTTLAARLGVNIADFEIAHSLEGQRGVLVLVVAERGARRVRGRAGRARLPRRPDGAGMSTGT